MNLRISLSFIGNRVFQNIFLQNPTGPRNLNLKRVYPRGDHSKVLILKITETPPKGARACASLHMSRSVKEREKPFISNSKFSNGSKPKHSKHRYRKLFSLYSFIACDFYQYEVFPFAQIRFFSLFFLHFLLYFLSFLFSAEMDFRGMKRKQLQALCKQHGVPANSTNLEMADRLSLFFKVWSLPQPCFL